MKKTKPKTIEDIIEEDYFGVDAVVTTWRSHGVGKNYNSILSNPLRSEAEELLERVVKQIKQLIADEVIGRDETLIIQSEYPELGKLKIDTTEVYNAIAINKLKKRQRKKLEKI